MDLTLQEIREALEYEEVERIVSFLEKREKRVGEKIAALQFGKSKIRLAKKDYGKKIQKEPHF